jgi:hypothetical protein
MLSRDSGIYSNDERSHHVLQPMIWDIHPPPICDGRDGLRPEPTFARDDDQIESYRNNHTPPMAVLRILDPMRVAQP